MANGNRAKIVVLTGFRFVTEDCITCGTLFAMSEDLWDRRYRDRKSFYCPNGHSMVFSGKTDADKLKDAEARETALRDQLGAAVREAESVRSALLRDRQRFANGVCPCCNRSFENVRRHMASQHPDYDATKVAAVREVAFECSCGKSFRTLHGLHIHQSRVRPDDWAQRSRKTDYWSKRSAHLTVV